MFGMNMDDQVLIPINFAKTIVDIRNERLGPLVMVKAKDGISANELIDELTGIMRSIRQTKLIGIQKALGAKNYFVLLQFLYESIILALIGGLFGLILIFILTIIFSAVADMEFAMSVWNVSLGLIISVSIGVIAGIVPAYNAAKLNPVEAIAST